MKKMYDAEWTNETESGWYVESNQEEENKEGDAGEFNNFITSGFNFFAEISSIFGQNLFELISSQFWVGRICFDLVGSKTFIKLKIKNKIKNKKLAISCTE